MYGWTYLMSSVDASCTYDIHWSLTRLLLCSSRNISVLSTRRNNYKVRRHQQLNKNKFHVICQCKNTWGLAYVWANKTKHLILIISVIFSNNYHHFVTNITPVIDVLSCEKNALMSGGTDCQRYLERLESDSLLLALAHSTSCLQCFDAVGWASGRASGL